MFWSSTTARRCTARMAITTGARAACCGGSSSRATARVSCDRPRRKNRGLPGADPRRQPVARQPAIRGRRGGLCGCPDARAGTHRYPRPIRQHAERCAAPAEAEAIYRQALAEAPADSDIHLQLGHALKLQGRHNEAVAAYRQAAALRPDNAEALRELFYAGSFDDQHQLLERRLAAGGVEAIMALGEEIARLQGAVQRLADKLPD